jgi:hypothetical protein
MFVSVLSFRCNGFLGWSRTISLQTRLGTGTSAIRIQRSTIDNSRSDVSDRRRPDYCLLAQLEHLQDLQEQLPGVEHEVQFSPQLPGSKEHAMC